MGSYEWPPSPDLAERFNAKVDFGHTDDCWNWMAFRNPSGYGMIRNGKRMALAHRVGWVLANGEVPLGRQVLHHCDNRACVNPAHLYIGTNADNIRDKVERGRSRFPHPERQGELHPMAKLSSEQVEEIRNRSTGARGEGRRFAREYGVSPSLISLIVNRKLWAHD